MPSQNISSDSAILSALRENNPFDTPPVVRAQNIWSESFPDIPSLNAKASNAVFEILRKVKSPNSDSNRVASMVFTAEKGVGKSHVISRIRKQLINEGKTVFIYAGADKYGDLDYINALFQRSVAESMEQIGSEGVTQWQDVATLIVTEALRARKKNATILSGKELVEKFDQIYYRYRDKGKDLVAELTRSIRQLKPNTDPYLLKAIIWTLSQERSSYAVKWLAGEQLDTQDAADLRLPTQDKSESERDALAITAVSKIFSLVSEYKSILICFDELDTIAVNSDGLVTEIVVLDLVKKLFDLIEQSQQSEGVVLLTAVLNHRWEHVTKRTNASADKIASDGVLNLEYLKADTTCELAAVNLKKFYSRKGIIPPTPIYPFEEEEISTFGEGRPLPREALAWLSIKLNEKINKVSLLPPPISYREKMERAYQNALAQFNDDVLDDNNSIASAIEFCFKKIIEIDKIKNQPIEGVIIKSVEEVTPKRENSGWLNCKIIGEENGEPVVIGISVIQQTHGLSVGAGFRRLLDTETFGLSRGCLVRSRARKIQRNWDSYEYYQQLVSQGGEWVDLIDEDIKPLLALQYIYSNHGKFDLSVKRLNSFSFTRNLLQTNPLIREILSRPEGVIAEEALEGEEIQHLNESFDLHELENELMEDLADEPILNETEVRSNLQEFVEALSA
jgi:hypothetical protein